MEDDSLPYLRKAVSYLVNPRKESFFYYSHKIYKIVFDENNYISFENISDVEDEVELSEEKYNNICKWFESDYKCYKSSNHVVTYRKGHFEKRELNPFECLCGTCAMFYCDFLTTETHFTTKEFEEFIWEYTRHKHTLKELLNYFHRHFRNKIVNANEKEDYENIDFSEEKNDYIFNRLSELNVDDGEYTIKHYENSKDIPYSYNISIINDKEKFNRILDFFQNDDKCVVDRISSRKLYKDNIMYTCRIRLKAEYDEFWGGSMKNEGRTNKKLIINEHQERLLIQENIKIHKGEKGKNCSTQGRWTDTIRCPHCQGNAYFSMSISDGDKGRGRIKVTDENGKEQDSEVQTIALYYCPNCYRFTAQNNMA